MKVNYKLLSKTAKAPVYSSESAGGADLYNDAGDLVISAGETVFAGTGLALEIPEGYVALIFARSGLASKQGLAPANKVGVVDSDYRGEVKVALFNHSNQTREIKQGERIAQMVVVPFLKCEFCEGELSETKRGEGGFGSTGK